MDITGREILTFRSGLFFHFTSCKFDGQAFQFSRISWQLLCECINCTRCIEFCRELEFPTVFLGKFFIKNQEFLTQLIFDKTYISQNSHTFKQFQSKSSMIFRESINLTVSLDANMLWKFCKAAYKHSLINTKLHTCIFIDELATSS